MHAMSYKVVVVVVVEGMQNKKMASNMPSNHSRLQRDLPFLTAPTIEADAL
jgi:hypothetical protein